MANSYFACKQFTIQQAANAMKVTTDGCTFGALLPALPQQGAGMRLLDVGTGTGLLSLMVAQKNTAAHITALEIDTAAADEARRNVAATPVGRHIEVITTDAAAYTPPMPLHGIFSNPPFHESQLQSPAAQRNVAHHSTQLSLERLLHLCAGWLHPQGWLALLLPYYRQQACINLASSCGLFPTQCLQLYSTTQHTQPMRSIIFFTPNSQSSCTHSALCIKGPDDAYTPEFADLLRPYYLAL